MFPYIELELSYKGKTDVGKKYENLVVTESSSLESAVLIEGRTKGFPNPYMTVLVEESETTTSETKVDFVDRNCKVVKTLKQGHTRSFLESAYLSPDSSKGETTDEFLKTYKVRPSFIVVKKIHTVQHYGRIGYQSHAYDIEVYSL